MPTEHPFDRVTLAELRRRRSAKWAYYPDDVLPAWVAEMDFPAAEPVRRVLREAIDADDLGYAMGTGLGEAFATWAEARWGWALAPRDVQLVADVVTGIAELLRVVTEPGDGVVIDTPVYHPFAATIRGLGRRVVATPLARTGAAGASASSSSSSSSSPAYALDLDAIARAYASGARAHLLCSPHNPTGIVYPRTALAEVARLADQHGVWVLSDEIHAPLTAPGVVHTPFPSLGEIAARRSIVLTSASKAWNLAGLKAAMLVGTSDEARARLGRLPPDLPFHAGHLGVLAGRAALLEGQAWLASANAVLERNRHLLAELLADALPEVRYTPPQASYLAWLDFRALPLGADADDPARALLKRGRVALSSGPMFGEEGKGFARLNLATPRSLLEEAVRRMASAVRHPDA